ncbi:MAG: PaaI family thioesterase [Desulfuromonadaceae bacterium]|nr:PaaI family thioesterase [Desulfuromonadaceae bacterium]
MLDKENIESQMGPHSVELDEWISCAPFEQALGIEITRAQDGYAELVMPFTYMLANGAAMLHGGAMTTLADTAAVFALKSLLTPGTHFATIHMEVDFLYPVMQGRVYARAQVEHQHGRSWKACVDLFDDAEREVMRMHAQFKVARNQPNLSAEQAASIPGHGAGK